MQSQWHPLVRVAAALSLAVAPRATREAPDGAAAVENGTASRRVATGRRRSVGRGHHTRLDLVDSPSLGVAVGACAREEAECRRRELGQPGELGALVEERHDRLGPCGDTAVSLGKREERTRGRVERAPGAAEPASAGFTAPSCSSTAA